MSLFEALIAGINKAKQKSEQGRHEAKEALKLTVELTKILQIATHESSKPEAGEVIQKVRDALDLIGGVSKALHQVPAAIDAYVAQIGGRSSSGAGGNAANAARHTEQLRVAEKANPLVESLRLRNGELPPNYITQDEAEGKGWQPGKAVNSWIPGAQIGGQIFANRDHKLPNAPGRKWHEADVGLSNAIGRNKQPGHRLVYSNDGLAYVTTDHYENFYQLPDWK